MRGSLIPEESAVCPGKAPHHSLAKMIGHIASRYSVFKMQKKHSKTILIVAAEASADIHGANLLRHIMCMREGIRIIGAGGEKIRSLCPEVDIDSSRLAVVGFTEVLGKFKEIVSVYRKLVRLLDQERPSLVILIDYPSFNIKLAGEAKKRGIPVFYYIGPQVWAWRRGRVKKIAQRVDRMALILPFEPEYYEPEGVDARFVGHPIMDRLKPFVRDDAPPRRFDPDDTPVICLMPGSRDKEVSVLLPRFLKAGELIAKRMAPVRFSLLLAPACSRTAVEEMILRHNIEVEICEEGHYDRLIRSRLAIIASGTATLEAAVLGVPMLVVYRTSWLSYLIAKLLVDVKYVGLVNIIAGREVVPELLQSDAKPELIADKACEILFDEVKMARMEESLAEVRGKIGQPGASRRAAEMAVELMESAK